MCELEYDKETLFKILQIVEDSKESIDEVTYIEICNMLKDMSTFPKLPPILIDGCYLRRVLAPTNDEMIKRFENYIIRIDKSICSLYKERIILDKNRRQIQLELDQTNRQNKRIRKKKMKVLDISRDIDDIDLHIENYNLEKMRYDQRIEILLELNPGDLYE